ncbi:MAG: SDR family oxidoreductase [Prochloraceae cyanobacterium]|nr:SDR family oxidoreductase [Prochloraceae cyanobacterium]
MSTYLITGANRGIGLEFCRQLKNSGNEVIAICREKSPELADLEVRIEDNIDIGNDGAIASLKERLKDTAIDVLINNAGIHSRNTLESLDFDDLLHQFNVNSLGALRVIKALLPNLKAGSKIAIITSRMASIDDNTSGSSYGYRMSKVALSMAGKSLAIDLKPKQIPVAILHPGLVQTRMTNFRGISTTEAVTGLLARIGELNLENTGTFWHSNGQVLPW